LGAFHNISIDFNFRQVNVGQSTVQRDTPGAEKGLGEIELCNTF
jgi:hypothetical protein